MKQLALWMVMGLAASAVQAQQPAPLEGSGLSVPAGAGGLWSRWQARVSVNPAAPAWRALPGSGDGAGLKLRGVNVVGDYFFGASATPSRLGSPAAASGFRATSGLMIGPRATLSLTEAPLDTQAIPYVGIGYTGAWAKSSWGGGWNISADLGVMAHNAGSAVKLGRVINGTQSLDDMLRDLRLSPVLQLGVSYSF